MVPIVDLAPGAEDNPLAIHFSRIICENLKHDPRRIAAFRSLRGAVLMVAQDTVTSITMRFDHGRLTIHDGGIGIPSVTFCGDEAVLLRLTEIAFHRWLRMPVLGLLHRRASLPLRETAALVTRGELKIYGLIAHPRFIATLLRIVSLHA